MRMRITIAGVSLIAVVAAVSVVLMGGRPHSVGVRLRPGFHVVDGRLYDAAGHEFVMRGVGHSHASYPQRTARMLSDVKAMGANTVRVEVSTGAVERRNDEADVAHVISLCRRNRLVCVLVVHDTTGWGYRPGAIPQSRAVDYWISIRRALIGQEKYAIVHVANEPYVLDNVRTWPTDTMDSIRRLRAAGIRHTLMVDAPDWGQDLSFTMRDHAAEVFAADPDHNTVFSIHMYGAFFRATNVHDYLGRYLAAKLPIAVTEFAYTHHDGDVDEDAIMSEAQAQRIGYLAWSWSGNTADVSNLDMVKGFDANKLTWWGHRVFDGPNGIRQTSREATVYAP
ncbi:cellulase family glycosylhydrolase [Dactylosporangium sp. AC04546]|uniref:cellulase family glycosylhydrolase n=1 Tax=Dactylosporangium sp. AC04546 TaxID=2862460 RepID=UPI001EE00261|nr:cellulase family glycosylhydrolase [Dactylosporangium sp. AC04546]WVK79162.1 cellulase family glycosylhydrolase [Dactylosporangium sp. AC04546]